MEQNLITNTIQNFARGADQQDLELVSGAFHPDAKQHFMGANGFTALPMDNYLQLLGDGKIGGKPRTLDIQNIDVNGSIASARVVMTGEENVFQYFLNLMKIDEGWKILHGVLAPITCEVI